MSLQILSVYVSSTWLDLEPESKAVGYLRNGEAWRKKFLVNRLGV